VEHVEGHLAGSGGVELYWQAWLPAQEPRAVVVIAHGAGEHSGRYPHVAERLVAAGYAAHALDHRGHGRSTGRRALVDRMDRVVADLDAFFSLAGSRHPGRPLFLLGHSMGGCIALLYALRHQQRLEGLLLSGAVARLDASAALKVVVRGLSRVAPALGVVAVDPVLVSRDGAVVRAYRDDPLVFHGKLPARTVAEMSAAADGFPAAVPALRLPLLVMHGGADAIVPVAGSRMVHERAGSADRTLRIYDGLYHEILNEPEQAAVLADVTGWLDAHTDGGAAGPGATGSVRR
jgi:alpha-beta hydrolase superfamily lysophospholipase